MNETIENLKKRLKVMKARKSNAVTLDVEYIELLVSEIEGLENSLASSSTQKEDSSSSSSDDNSNIIIHGGQF